MREVAHNSITPLGEPAVPIGHLPISLNASSEAGEIKMATIKFELSQTVSEGGKNVRQKLEDLAVYCPTLKEFGIDVEPVEFDKATGEAVYESNAHKFIYSAVVAAVKTAARNKFQPKSATLRVGAKIAETLEELVAPTVSNKGAALVERRQLLDMFKQWLAASGKPEAVQRLLLGMLDKTDNLLLQEADKKLKIQGYFNAFGEAVAERLTEWQIAYLQGAIEACEGEEIDF